MTAYKGFKFRLYPTKEQAERINKTLGCCRYVYNHMLERRIKAYKRRKESFSYIGMQNLLPGMKKYLPWLTEADSQALKYACRCLDDAYKGFFKNGHGFPKFKLAEQGKKLITIDKWFPSSKLCRHCGYVNDVLTLSDRVWVCPSCGETILRDKNAAINIRNAGVAQIA